MDYREVKRKNGQVLVFCNFEELLTEAFGVPTMKEVEQFSNNSGEYICHCPFCKAEGHTKHKLYIKDDLTVGHCFVCCRDFVHVTDKVDCSFHIPSFSAYSSNGLCSDLNLIKLSDPNWTLDKFNNEFDDYDEVGVDYLKSRHPFMEQLYKILDFKFLDGNVVMPFKYKDEIFYYQIRFSGNSSIRYFFPPISDKPPYIIEHGDNKQFIICEGVYDAIANLIMAPNYTPMAVLGSSISDYQLKFLREYVPTKIIIYMDKTEISVRIAEKIKQTIDYCPISIIKSNGEDPEECMKRKLKAGANLQWIK